MKRKLLFNQEEQYPIVLLPSSIMNSLIHGFDDDILNPRITTKKPVRDKISPPSEPLNYKMEPYQSFDFDEDEIGLFGNIIIAIVICSTIFLIWDHSITKKLIVLGILFFIILSVLERNNRSGHFYPEKSTKSKRVLKSEIEYKRDLEEYQEKLPSFEEEKRLMEKKFLKEYDEYVANVSLEKKKISRKIHLENLGPRGKSSRVFSPPKRGLTELDFFKKARGVLPNHFFLDISVSRSSYCPDMTLICPETNLHIDIEIDEPYTLQDKKPIHFETSDSSRNDFFLQCNWVVIRFAEEQIITKPNECIETIQSVLNSVRTMENNYYSQLPLIKTWDYEDATIMADENYRRKYL